MDATPISGLFRIFASHLLDKGWPPDQISIYLDLAVMAWNTSFLPKPERIAVIESYIRDHECPFIKLGVNRYDTLELTVALVHIKKALFPDIHSTIGSAVWDEEDYVIHLEF